MRKLLMLSAILCSSACVAPRPIVQTPPAACSRLIPNGWTQGVEASPVPQNAAVPVGTPLTAALAASIVAPWASAYVAMSAALDKANGRTADTVAIVTECEKQANAARPPAD